METVGIRLSVCLSLSVRQAGSLDSPLPVSTVEVICLSVMVLVYVSGSESGDVPRISVEMTKVKQVRETKSQKLEQLLIFFTETLNKQ